MFSRSLPSRRSVGGLLLHACVKGLGAMQAHYDKKAREAAAAAEATAAQAGGAKDAW